MTRTIGLGGPPAALFAIAVAGAALGCGASEPTGPVTAPDPATARYQVTFDATWSSTSHPTDFPASAHFSGLIGGTHSTAVSFWSPGGIATDGVRVMAELGGKSPLDDEVRAAVSAGGAERVLSGGGIARSPGTVSLEFEIGATFPLVTLVSMVAPSPDWFVGVSGLNLRPNGRWVDGLTVDLLPYDAGTDGGTTFLSPDQAIVPRQPIGRILGHPFRNGDGVPPLGTFTFRRIN
ncbi:MAG: spondin domain-containing protein [Gemmatimonadales bacterium]